MKKIKIMIAIIFLFIIYIYVAYITVIPNSVVLFGNESFNYKKLIGITVSETQKTMNDNYNVSNMEFKLFGQVLLKNTNITKIEDIEVVPVGKIIGLKLYTDGVLVVGKSEIEDINNNLIKPYENIDIKEGDTILSINEEKV